MFLRFAVMCLVLVLSGCAESVWAPDPEVQRALWRAEGPPNLTLVTVVRLRDGAGRHSALLVNGSHRALFDPAGTFRMSSVPERNDVLFGITDRALAVYVDYHARATHDVRLQEIEVTPEQAEAALRAMQEEGPAAKATCNLAVTRVLRQVPGFENAPGGFLPNRTAEWFSTLPGIQETVVSDESAERIPGVLFVEPEPSN